MGAETAKDGLRGERDDSREMQDWRVPWRIGQVAVDVASSISIVVVWIGTQ